MPIRSNIDEIKRNKTFIQCFIRPGIQSYKTIMELYSAPVRDVNLLCHFFFDFYNIRGLDSDFQRACFNSFLDDPTRKFQDLHKAMNEITGRNEFSLSTKLYHTAHPGDGIIVDKYVRDFCGRAKDVQNFDLWKSIGKDFENSRVNDLINVFDELFEHDRGISRLKKIDFMIWGWGKWKKFCKTSPNRP